MKVLEREERIRRCGGEAVFVVHDEPGRLATGLLADLECPFPVLLDLERDAYGAWGLIRTSWWKVYLDPKVWWSYTRLLLVGGERWRPGGRDTLQLGGDFVVAPDGTLAYSRPQERDDRPPVGELVAVMERVAG